MEIIYSDHILPHHPLVATIGFFDGVHRGHQYLIEQLKQEAARRGLPAAVITFPVHPGKVLNSGFQPALLCGYEEKLAHLAKTEIDYCIPLDFTPAISCLSAKEFIQSVLKHQLGVDTLLIGYDHRFGHQRTDGFEQYVQYGEEVRMKLVQARELSTSEPISSSRIRLLLAAGDIVHANQMLGYNYSISGRVIEGFKIGRTLGFPTANIEIWEDFKVIPAFGVYAVRVKTGGISYGGMLYIGNRPTLENGENVSLEVNIFDFEGNLYGKSLSVEFIDFVRPDKKFPDITILKQQICDDQDKVIKILRS